MTDLAKETLIAAKTHILATHAIRVELCKMGYSYCTQMKINGRPSTAIETYNDPIKARDAFDLMNEMAQSLVAVIGK